MAMAVLDTKFLCKYEYKNNGLWHVPSTVSTSVRVVQRKGFHTKKDSKTLIITTRNGSGNTLAPIKLIKSKRL